MKLLGGTNPRVIEVYAYRKSNYAIFKDSLSLSFCSVHVRLLRALIKINQSINQSIDRSMCICVRSSVGDIDTVGRAVDGAIHRATSTGCRLGRLLRSYTAPYWPAIQEHLLCCRRRFHGSRFHGNYDHRRARRKREKEWLVWADDENRNIGPCAICGRQMM